MHTGNKNNEFSYEMNGKVLDKVLIEKGLGIMISSDMKSSQQCVAACNCYCHRRRIGVLCLNIV